MCIYLHMNKILLLLGRRTGRLQDEVEETLTYHHTPFCTFEFYILKMYYLEKKV